MDHLSIDVHEKTKLFICSPIRQLVIAARQQTQTPGRALTQWVGFKMPDLLPLPTKKGLYLQAEEHPTFLPVVGLVRWSLLRGVLHGFLNLLLVQPSGWSCIFTNTLRRCFSAFIKFNYYYRLLSIPQNVSLSTSCQECFCLSHQDHTDTSAQLQSKRMQLLDWSNAVYVCIHTWSTN